MSEKEREHMREVTKNWFQPIQPTVRINDVTRRQVIDKIDALCDKASENVHFDPDYEGVSSKWTLDRVGGFEIEVCVKIRRQK